MCKAGWFAENFKKWQLKEGEEVVKNPREICSEDDVDGWLPQRRYEDLSFLLIDLISQFQVVDRRWYALSSVCCWVWAGTGLCSVKSEAVWQGTI